jgi:hypothetical protein
MGKFHQRCKKKVKHGCSKETLGNQFHFNVVKTEIFQDKGGKLGYKLERRDINTCC